MPHPYADAAGSVRGIGAVEKVLKGFLRVMEAFEFKKPGRLGIRAMKLLDTRVKPVGQVVARINHNASRRPFCRAFRDKKNA